MSRHTRSKARLRWRSRFAQLDLISCSRTRSRLRWFQGEPKPNVVKLVASVLLLVSLFTHGDEHAEKHITIAVATNFMSVVSQIAESFEADSNITTTVSSGSTGKLYAQIVNGIPVDVFLSADQQRVSMLIESDLAYAESRITYAIGRLALWHPDATVEGLASTIALLKSNDTAVLARADPKLAPYGLAAAQTMGRCVDLDGFDLAFTTGENIGQTFAHVFTRNADMGFVALPSLLAHDIFPHEYRIVDNDCHDPIRQDAIILKSTDNATTARNFLNYLQKPKILTLIHEAGYETP